MLWCAPMVAAFQCAQS